VTQMSVRGERDVVWIAEGPVKKTDENMWRFNAVERADYKNSKMVSRYPLGRAVEIGAANVLVQQTEKPEWLKELDADAGDTLWLKKQQVSRADGATH
jgi:hypothetical protein